MMVTKEQPAAWADYLALVETFPLQSIRDDEQLTRALPICEALIKKAINQALSEGEEAYYLALTDLIETFEERYLGGTEEQVSGVELLRYLMEENGLTPTDLAPILGPSSLVSDVLSGTRQMTIAHRQALARRFHLAADAFAG